MYFVLEESSWTWDGQDPANYVLRIQALLERLAVAVEREEAFMLSGALLTQTLCGSSTVGDLLWGHVDGIELPHDARELATALLAHLQYWDEDGEYSELDAEIEGIKVFSPSAAYAHARIGTGEVIACIPLPGRWRGPCIVTVRQTRRSMHFVTDEVTHRGFFRAEIEAKKREAALERLAVHAFPDTYFVDGIWRGLRDFKGGYTRVRSDLLRFLELFDDYATWIFSDTTGRLSAAEFAPSEATKQSIGDKLLMERFGALGLNVSPESREVYETQRSRTAREVHVRGRALYCEWHYKVERHTNRVHFHAPVRESGNKPIIAIFHEHLYLPGD